MGDYNLPAEAVGLQLFRINRRDEAVACEPMKFGGGPLANRPP